MIQTVATILGMVGAIMVAGKTPTLRLMGFSTWIVSNLCWVISGFATTNYNIIANFGFFLIMAFFGLKNNYAELRT